MLMPKKKKKKRKKSDNWQRDCPKKGQCYWQRCCPKKIWGGRGGGQRCCSGKREERKKIQFKFRVFV